MEKNCIVCQSIVAGRSNTCSVLCRKNRRKETRKNSNANVTIVRTCGYCSSTFNALRFKPKKFCNRSCASKYYINNGTFDAWRYRTNKPAGVTKPCWSCQKLVYIEPRYKDNIALCGNKTCRNIYISSLFSGDGNPMAGRHLSAEQKQKQKNTLLNNYGVSNAYLLAKRRKISKPQQELYEYVRLCDNSALLEQHVQNIGMRYFADILLPESKKIVEFHGDYWHCNPKTYSSDYFHKVKNKTAKEIWEEDLKRRHILETHGYTLLYVWETDYKNNLATVQTQIKEFINE